MIRAKALLIKGLDAEIAIEPHSVISETFRAEGWKTFQLKPERMINDQNCFLLVLSKPRQIPKHSLEDDEMIKWTLD
ncbi:hypothetical protein TNCV_835191 [Trichonephila clavipes]|nr:hypothetical protein TNCV_835191 [Trichonephila clavipes]